MECSNDTQIVPLSKQPSNTEVIITGAIYAWYSNATHVSIVTFNMNIVGNLISASKVYHLTKNRALLAGAVDIIMTKLPGLLNPNAKSTFEYINIITDSSFMVNAYNRRWNPEDRHSDLVKLLQASKMFCPNLTFELRDEHPLLSKCKKDAIKKLKSQSLIKRYIDKTINESLF